MKKMLSFAAILVISVFLTACGKVSKQATDHLAKEANITIEIRVSVSQFTDPVLLINAKEVELDATNKKVVIRGAGFIRIPEGLLSDSVFGIQVNDATFSVPLGGRITINYPNGKTEVLECYGVCLETEQK